MTARNQSDGRETYQIGPDCDMRTSQFINGRTIYLGEPLCAGCDQPIADGPCDCMIPALVETPVRYPTNKGVWPDDVWAEMNRIRKGE